MKSIEWIDKAKQALGATADAAVSERLGMKSATMSQHRTGKNKTLSDENCVMIAEICGIDPAIVIADQQAERASPTVRKVYERLGKLVAHGAVGVLATICLALPSKGEANQGHSRNFCASSVYYVKYDGVMDWRSNGPLV